MIRFTRIAISLIVICSGSSLPPASAMKYSIVSPASKTVASGDFRSADREDCRETGLSNAIEVIGATGVKNFVHLLNEAGRCRYKLVALTKHPLGVSEGFEQLKITAILKLDSKRYEYDWFEAFNPGEAQTRINYRADSGFRFRAWLPIAQDVCKTYETRPSDSPDEAATREIFNRVRSTLSFSIGAVYIMEREVDSPERAEYRVILGTWGRGKSPTDSLSAELDGSLRSGYEPIAAGPYKFLNSYGASILVERNEESPVASELPQYQIVISEFGFEKKINRLSKSGFRLEFEGHLWAKRFALMSRTRPAEATTYTWIDASSKKLAEKLSAASAKGFAYKAASSQVLGCDYADNRLIFQRVDTRAPAGSEIKVVKLTKDTTGEFHTLLAQGYNFRDLFFSGEVNAILERPRN